MDLATKKKKIPSCDLYYDMKYTVPYLTFSNIDNGKNSTLIYDYSDKITALHTSEIFMSMWFSLIQKQQQKQKAIQLRQFHVKPGLMVLLMIVMWLMEGPVKITGLMGQSGLYWICILDVEPCPLVFASVHLYLASNLSRYLECLHQTTTLFILLTDLFCFDFKEVGC